MNSTRGPLGGWTLTALFVAAVVPHVPAFENGLALDDRFILANPAIQSLRTLPATLASPWWYTTNGLYRPLTLASFAIERAIAGTSPFVPHVVNVALHGCVTVLLACLLARFAAPAAAACGALFFAVLPAHTEAIATIVGRGELLSALALVSLMLLVTGGNPPTPRNRMWACLLGAAALAAKEGGVVAPVIAFAAVWARPAQRPQAMRWTVSTAAGTLIMLMARVAVLGTWAGDVPNPAFRILTSGQRLLTAFTMMPRVAVALVLPVAPPIDYVPTLQQLTHPALTLAAAGALILVGVAIACGRQLIHTTLAGFGVWVVSATVAPTANLLFPTGVVLTGRTLYAPALGAAILVTALVSWRGSTRYVRVMYALLAVFALGGGAVSWRESAVWRSSESAILEMRQRHPDDYRSFLLLGYMARDQGNDREALVLFRQAAVRFAGDPEMLTDAAAIALRLRDTTTARSWLAQAIAVHPAAARARTRLLGILLSDHDTTAARRLLLDGLVLEPNQRVWSAALRALPPVRQ